MKKLDFKEHKKFKDLLIKLPIEKTNRFYKIYDKHINKNEFSISKKFRKCETLCEIIKNNDKDYEKLFLEYFLSNDNKRKLEIKYDQNKVVEYENKLKSRQRPKKPHSIFDYKFWICKGFSEEESKQKVKEIQLNNVKKRTKNSYKDFSFKLKFSLEYWTNQGYTLEEAEILRQPYLQKIKNNLETFIEKYGVDEGTKKWIIRCEKYKTSIKKNLQNRKTGGYVSKESLRFFIPLYKFCRKLGLKRNEIYFGINGSREFFIKDTSFEENVGKFYDFCIPKLNLIIEYHGTFWHPKNSEEWENPWKSFAEAFESDKYKENLAKKRNMEYHIVWSDENLNEKFLEFTELIKRKYNES
jgi:hypothetical protein